MSTEHAITITFAPEDFAEVLGYNEEDAAQALDEFIEDGMEDVLQSEAFHAFAKMVREWKLFTIESRP